MIFYKVAREGVDWLSSEKPFRTPQQVEAAYLALKGKQLRLFDEVCAGLPTAESYAKTHAEEFGWDEEVMQYARVFIPQKLTLPVPYFEKPWHCFENSFVHAERTGLLYVEGLAINPSGPQIHAWNSTDGTDVLDYTWPFQHINHYFGVVFDLEKLKKYWPIQGAFLAYRKEQSKDVNFRLVAR